MVLQRTQRHVGSWRIALKGMWDLGGFYPSTLFVLQVPPALPGSVKPTMNQQADFGLPSTPKTFQGLGFTSLRPSVSEP